MMTSAEFARLARVLRKMGASEISVSSTGDYAAKFGGGSSVAPGQQRLVMLPAPPPREQRESNRNPSEDDSRTDRQKWRDEALEAMKGG